MGRYMPQGWPLPAIDDLTRDFFTTGRLLLQQCRECGTIQHPPEEVCFNCQATRFTSVESRGRGHIYSYIVTHYPVSPLLKERVPYAVALVELNDYPAVRVLGNVLDLPPDGLHIGLPVRVTYEEIVDQASAERLLMPQWQADR